MNLNQGLWILVEKKENGMCAFIIEINTFVMSFEENQRSTTANLDNSAAPKF